MRRKFLMIFLFHLPLSVVLQFFRDHEHGRYRFYADYLQRAFMYERTINLFSIIAYHGLFWLLSISRHCMDFSISVRAFVAFTNPKLTGIGFVKFSSRFHLGFWGGRSFYGFKPFVCSLFISQRQDRLLDVPTYERQVDYAYRPTSAEWTPFQDL